jgi:hypothetical protein
MQVQLELPDSVNVDPSYVKEAVEVEISASRRLSS